MMDIKVGLVVPFFKGYNYIEKLISSLGDTPAFVTWKVMIIDNSPQSLPIHWNSPENGSVEVIREKAGLGYGKACNAGYEICKKEGYDYLIIANQDGYFSGNFIQEILRPFEQDEQIIVSVPLLRTYSSNEIEGFFIQYYLHQLPSLVSDLIAGNMKTSYELKKISGACFAFRLKNNNYRFPYLFDPLFHMYFEDEDLCRRIHQTGGKIIMAPRAVFYHQHSHTTDMENRDTIEADKLVSEKILRLKEGSKSTPKALYGIFVSTASIFTYFFLRGEFRKSFLYIRSFFIILFRLPSILRTKQQEIFNSRNI